MRFPSSRPSRRVQRYRSSLLLLQPAGAREVVTSPRRCRKGKRLKDARPETLASVVGKSALKGVSHVVLQQSAKSQGEEVTVVLTPEEQELVKNIDAKASQAAFSVNIRLLASAATKERAENILSHLENAFSQFENPEVNSFRVRKRISSKRAAYQYIFRNFSNT